MRAIYRKRFANLIRVLRDAQKSEDLRAKFTMNQYGFSATTTAYDACGTPACAMGHYAFRKDVQRTFSLNTGGWVVAYDGHHIPDEASHFAEHFGISLDEVERLFGFEGCNNAKTPKQAADFLAAWLKKETRK